MSATDHYLARPWLAHYQKGVPASIEVPLKTVTQAFDEATERSPERPAVVFYGRRISYRELRDATDRLACALARLGVKKGDRVALYLLNSPQFIIAYFAALKCGATVTPISPVYTSHEVRFQLEDSGARVAICQDILYEKVAKSGATLDFVVVTNVAEYLPALKRLFAKKSAISAKVYWLQELLKAHPPEPPAVALDPKTDLAALPYTGGTTGNPKGVMLTHYNLVAAQTMGQAAFSVFEPGKEVILAFLPFFHIYGQVVIMLNGLCQGNLLVLFTSPDTEAILDAMERYRATVFYGVPTLYEYLKDHKDTNKTDWKRLKLVLSGADTLHESTMKGWARRTGSNIVEGYGLSETCATSHVNPLHRPKSGSFGCPIPGMQAAVMDPETLEFVPPGESGELVLCGPNVMQGYWQRPEETARAFVERAGVRWMRTGDIVRMDEEGYFHFYDRSKDLIKYKGYSIFAKDVEDVLYGHPQVKAAGVIGVADPAVGQRIKAIVVLQGDARGKVSEEEIKAYCRQSLAEYKVPHLVEFRGELPKTDVGKVSRRELREESST
ncbi:MAG: AMP-dependent synthetase [Betaproteobacteria bacterium RIFCSPLOWO2_12_FULL_68_19]|nr:MAG: AMP-dependent synthetase [Betaproteobacteria bacterium RIFCSPLOWO2_12_FULL_68_19]